MRVFIPGKPKKMVLCSYCKRDMSQALLHVNCAIGQALVDEQIVSEVTSEEFEKTAEKLIAREAYKKRQMKKGL